MISWMSRVFAASLQVVLSFTAVASAMPPGVTGHWGFTTAAARFVGRWCDSFVLVTS
jgi:hypothetical protein